jgi:histidine triad (HIT) family protein
MEPSIFTRIIKGEVPCHKVYEDDRVIAFMDIHPVLPGHMLVVPKVQIDHFDDLPEADYTALFLAVKKLAAKAKQAMGTKRALVSVMGFDVPHAHVHVIPANSNADYYAGVARIKEIMALEPNHAELSQLAERLKS